jgi:AcrR family transcriptional regulator
MKEDLRVRRTRKRIQEALIELTVEKGYNRVTVQDIVERAVINRSTFYRHYLDKDDLLSKYMDEVTGVTFKDDDADEPHDQQGIPSGLIKLLNHTRAFSEFYRIMLGANGHPLVSDRLRRKIESRIRLLIIIKGVKQDVKSPFLDMQLKYISGAGIGAILWWVENGTPSTSEELATWIGQLSAAAVRQHQQ